jgi:hypothetical protein
MFVNAAEDRRWCSEDEGLRVSHAPGGMDRSANGLDGVGAFAAFLGLAATVS